MGDGERPIRGHRPAVVTQFLQTFEEFPPRQKAASFTIDQAVAKLETAPTTGQ